jgi:hypothetical protein
MKLSNFSKKIRFAITDNTTYEGKDAVDFFSEALLDGVTLKQFRTIPGVKSKIKLPQYDAGSLIKDAGCSWSPAGEGTLSQKSFEVCDKEFQLELCVTTFEANFLGEYLRAGSNTGEVAPELFTNYMLEQVKKKVQNDLELAIWQGDATGATYPYNVCDGLIKEMEGDATVIDVTGATGVTLANVIAEITKVYNLIPAEILNNPNLVIFVGTSIYKLYQQAVAAASNEAYYVGAKEPNFLGIPLVWSPGMPADTMVCGVKENFLLLTDLLDDYETVTVVPQWNVAAVATMRIAGRFKFGVSYLVGSEVVLYQG